MTTVTRSFLALGDKAMSRAHTLLPFLVAVLVVAGSAPAAEKPVVMTVRLADFESPQEMAKWNVRASKPPTLWQLSTDHAASGKTCAKLVTPSLKQSGQRWPAVVLPAKHLAVRDWSPYEHLVLDALNPSDRPVPLLIHLRSAKGARWHKPATVPPGRQTVRVALDGSARTQPVDELHLFYNDPPEPYTIYLDNLRLETGDQRVVVRAVLERLERLGARVPRGYQRQARSWRDELIDAIEGQIQRVVRDFEVLGKTPSRSSLARWQKTVGDTEALLGKLATQLTMAKIEATSADKVWGYGWTHGVCKVFRTDRPFKGTIGGALKVELAANEYEGVQLVLRSKKPLKGVKVALSDLKLPQVVAPPGSPILKRPRRIAAKDVEVLPVGYVNTKRPPYPVSYVGWWPDPLLNFLDSFDLDADVWQPVWLDVHTAPDQAPGEYRGAITCTAEGVEPLEIPISVTVWDFSIPTEYHFPLAVVFWDGQLRQIYSKDPDEWAKFADYYNGKADLASLGTGEARRLAELRRKCHDLILAHHLIPDRIYRAYPPRIEDVQRWKAHGARWFNILHVPSIRSLKAGQPYPADRKKRILDLLADYVPKLKKEGLLDMAYIYGFDEIRPNEFAAVKDIFGAIKKRYPTIPLMTTAYDQSFGTKTGLDPYIDIWVPLTPVYGRRTAEIAAARKRGRKVWWYICCGPRNPYANWFVEYTAAEHRLVMGLMPWKFHSDGFLHYSMNLWQTNRRVTGADGKARVVRNAPFTEPITRGPLTNSDGKSWTDYNGDGLIFYPGPDGPVPTIRMKCIRDGLEDYEYLWLLQQAVRRVNVRARPIDQAWMARATAALAVDPAVVRTLTDYSTHGADILATRRAIAQLLAGGRP